MMKDYSGPRGIEAELVLPARHARGCDFCTLDAHFGADDDAYRERLTIILRLEAYTSRRV
jgi:hypothetical protein